MLYEYADSVSHDSYLTDEERHMMSERNRGAASHTLPEPEPEQQDEPPRSERRWRNRRNHFLGRRMRRSRTTQEEFERPIDDEQAAALARMEQTERNREAARRANQLAEESEQQTPETVAYEEYEDEYDVGTNHAASVARSSLRRDPDAPRGWFLAFPFISGSSALRPEELHREAELPQEPETVRDEMPEARAAADSAQDETEGRQKVSGGRYSDYSRSGGYQRRITTGGPIIIGLLTVLLIGCVIYGKVQTNEVYTQIAELQAEYDDITARNVSMKSEMEGKLTVKNIEDYAKNVLGLRPLDQSQIEYIQIQTEDEVIITKPEQNLIVTINDYITSFWEFLRGA